MSDLTLWQSLDGEMATMAEQFSSLVRASRIPDEDLDAAAALGSSTGANSRRAPGDLLEVWAEKLLYTSYTCLHILSELKKGAMVSDFNALMDNVRNVRKVMDEEAGRSGQRIAVIGRDAQDLLAELEASYYSSEHRGRLLDVGVSAELQELCHLALEAPNGRQP